MTEALRRLSKVSHSQFLIYTVHLTLQLLGTERNQDWTFRNVPLPRPRQRRSQLRPLHLVCCSQRPAQFPLWRRYIPTQSDNPRGVSLSSTQSRILDHCISPEHQRQWRCLPWYPKWTTFMEWAADHTEGGDLSSQLDDWPESGWSALPWYCEVVPERLEEV